MSLADVNEDRTVYLVSDATVDSPDSFRRWLRRNYKALFEMELEGWYTDPDLWPANRSFAVFFAWFEVEYHSVIVDLVGKEIYDDEL